MTRLESLIEALDGSVATREALLMALEEKTESFKEAKNTWSERRHIWNLLHDALHWTPESILPSGQKLWLLSSGGGT